MAIRNRHAIPLAAWLGSALLLAGLLLTRAAWALTPEDARAAVEGGIGDRVAVVQRLVASGDPAAARLLRALAQGTVRFDARGVYVVDDMGARDAVTGQPVTVLPDAEDALVNNRLRGVLETALAALDLIEGADPARQREAARLLRSAAVDDADTALLALLQRVDAALANRTVDPSTRRALDEALAAAGLASEEPSERQRAADLLARSAQPAIRPLIERRLAEESDPAVRAALQHALAAVERRQALTAAAGQLFAGLSLGSILLLAALGLAITYGLMGVINMAHGEMIMIGAYATYAVQVAFQRWWPQALEYYVLAAIPVAFFTTAAVGAAIERGVIRHLYGRPLETLLATWGLSLILMQAVRSLFGAQNVAVENPGWLSGGVDVGAGLILPWNRIAVLIFAALVLAGVALLIARTRFGLFVRGVTQNRPIAACMGVNTARVDMFAFAFGSGVAGLAGVALSQLGNVGPDLGQTYIIDSFMVVVVGGVGQLAGSVLAALGLGLLNKLLEGWAGAVLAKIVVLLLIIAFIQKRPQGLFALRGRTA
ncbi:MAG: urea ABC transporter permease subunit UrtB [Tepidimonas taiwanensis]|nr:urea ABC transporter permease subunit UrtB [Tepidimonas taiwanensis]